MLFYREFSLNLTWPFRRNNKLRFEPLPPLNVWKKKIALNNGQHFSLAEMKWTKKWKKKIKKKKRKVVVARPSSCTWSIYICTWQ